MRSPLPQNTVLWIDPVRKAEEVAVLSAPVSLFRCLQWWSQVPNKRKKGEHCKSQSGTAELEVGFEPSVSLVSSAFNYDDVIIVNQTGRVHIALLIR